MTAINTNTAALLAKAYGQKANQNMLQPMERLSSGLRINGASDDAAGLAVVNKMNASIKDYDLSIRKSVDMISLLSTAESALEQISNVQIRLRDLAVQSANGIYLQQDRDSMELELYGLVAEIDRIAQNTKYNDVNLLDGTFNATGSSSRDIIPISIEMFSTSAIGRYWAEDNFENATFETAGSTTNVSPNVNRIPGWEIHNVRVELGQGVTPGTTIIGNYNAPIDSTPTPYNAVNGDNIAPANAGSLGNGGTGFALEDGGLKLTSSGLTSVNGYDIVHGPYVISQSEKQISAGDVVEFDWKSAGTNDAASIYGYLLNVANGNSIELINDTQPTKTTTNWATNSTTVNTTGNYKFVFISGTYDASGGKALGADMYIDNVKIKRNRLPADMQHLVSQISVQSVAEAKNAAEVLAYSIEQTGFKRAIIGALVNRYQSVIEGSSMRGMDMREARSRVRDADYAIETSKLAKQQILAQASMAMLAQAGNSKRAVLELI